VGVDLEGAARTRSLFRFAVLRFQPLSQALDKLGKSLRRGRTFHTIVVRPQLFSEVYSNGTITSAF
jgi:hypothetical protein